MIPEKNKIYISEKVVLTGNIEAHADLVIDGEMYGNIEICEGCNVGEIFAF